MLRPADPGRRALVDPACAAASSRLRARVAAPAAPAWSAGSSRRPQLTHRNCSGCAASWSNTEPASAGSFAWSNGTASAATAVVSAPRRRTAPLAAEVRVPPPRSGRPGHLPGRTGRTFAEQPRGAVPAGPQRQPPLPHCPARLRRVAAKPALLPRGGSWRTERSGPVGPPQGAVPTSTPNQTVRCAKADLGKEAHADRRHARGAPAWRSRTSQRDARGDRRPQLDTCDDACATTARSSTSKSSAASAWGRGCYRRRSCSASSQVSTSTTSVPRRNA